MRRFEWKVVILKGVRTLSLLEILDEGKSRQFWGSINLQSEGGGYDIAAFDKDRVLRTTDLQVSTIEEARTAIEEFLTDSRTLSEGDEIEYIDI